MRRDGLKEWRHFSENLACSLVRDFVPLVKKGISGDSGGREDPFALNQQSRWMN